MAHEEAAARLGRLRRGLAAYEVKPSQVGERNRDIDALGVAIIALHQSVRLKKLLRELLVEHLGREHDEAACEVCKLADAELQS